LTETATVALNRLKSGNGEKGRGGMDSVKVRFFALGAVHPRLGGGARLFVPVAVGGKGVAIEAEEG